MVMKIERLHGRQEPNAYLEPCQTSKMNYFAKIDEG